MSTAKKLFFASDFHLGLPSEKGNHSRENLIVSWLDSIKEEATEIYLMGDIFDFWFEYTHVVPKGQVRLMGKLAELSDAGIALTIFKGNHDMWMRDYLATEIGATIISNELIIEKNGKKFYLHHGDGLGPGDYGYKFIKAIFRNPLSQLLFKIIHPDIGIGLARYLSAKSRKKNYRSDLAFKGEEKEFLIQFAKKMSQNQSEHFDYFVFGHRHLPLQIPIDKNSTYINLGEWVTHFTYAEFDGNTMELKTFTGDLLASR